MKYKISFEIITRDPQDEVEKYVNDILQDMTGEEIDRFSKVKVKEI